MTAPKAPPGAGILLLALAATGCGSREVAIFPSPGAAAPRGAAVAVEKGGARVAPSTAEDLALFPVAPGAVPDGEGRALSVTGRFASGRASTLVVVPVGPGGIRGDVLRVPLGTVRRHGTFSARDVALPEGPIEAIGIGLDPPVEATIGSVAIVVGSGGGPAARFLREGGSNAWLLALALATSLGALAVHAALRAAGRRSPITREGSLALLSGAIVAAWIGQGVLSESRVARALVDPGPPESRRPRARAAAMAEEARARAVLVESAVPPSERIAVSPSERTMGTYRLQDAILPRIIATTPCQGWDDGRVPSYVLARPGCFQDRVILALETDGVGSRARLAARGEPRWLRQLEVRPAGGGGTLALALAGRPPLWGAALRAGEGTVDLPLVEVPPGEELVLSCTTAVEEVALHLVPPGFVAVRGNDWGDVVLSREGTPAGRTVAFLHREPPRPHPGDVPRLLGGLLLALLAGHGILGLCLPGAAIAPGARLAYSWLLGIGAAAVIVHATTMAGLGWSRSPFAVLAVLAFAGVRAWRRRALPDSPSDPRTGRSRPWDRALAAVLLLLVAVAAAHALRRAPSENDELFNWILPAHLFFHTGPTTAAMAAYADFAPIHVAYPPGLSLAATYAGLSMKHWHGTGVLAPFPLFYASMILLVLDAVRRDASRTRGLLFAALAGSASLPSSMASQAMADLPLGCCFAAAVLAIERWDGSRAGGGWLAVAALLGGLMPTYKREGGPLRLILIAVALLWLLRHGPWRRVVAGLLGFAALGFLPSLPWWIAYRDLRASDWVLASGNLAPEELLPRLALLPEIIRSLAHLLFLPGPWGPSLWNATFVLLLVVMFLAPGRFFRRERVPSTVALAAGLAGYCLIYVVSPLGMFHLSTSFGRLLLHLFPLAAALCGRVAFESPAAVSERRAS